MPTYDYRCEKCHKAFSMVLTIKKHDERRILCPRCGSRAVRQQIRTFYAITSHKA